MPKIQELVTRTGIDPEEIDLSVFGVVVPALHAPNLGRALRDGQRASRNTRASPSRRNRLPFGRLRTVLWCGAEDPSPEQIDFWTARGVLARRCYAS
jgi:hypothetical protein